MKVTRNGPPAKLLILLSNDDGVNARGLAALRRAVRGLGEIWVVAPDREKSACSLSITLNQPLRVHQIGPRIFSADGTPADCIYLAVQKLLPRRPDILISGINSGPNLARQDISYSGTVAAALQGSFLDIPSMAVSLTHDGRGRYDYAYAGKVVRSLVQQIIRKPHDPKVTINVNIPPPPFKGIRVTVLGEKRYNPEIVEKEDPRGKLYYWISTGPLSISGSEKTDVQAVKDGFISITPLYSDLTDYKYALRPELKKLTALLFLDGVNFRKARAGRKLGLSRIRQR